MEKGVKKDGLSVTKKKIFYFLRNKGLIELNFA